MRRIMILVPAALLALLCACGSFSAREGDAEPPANEYAKASAYAGEPLIRNGSADEATETLNPEEPEESAEPAEEPEENQEDAE